MVLTGISAKLKDKRIDRILKKHGYTLSNCEIFYSPITVWLFLLPFFLLTIISTVSYFFFYLIYLFPLYFLLYFMLGYLVVGYLNNSFVITENKLLVINPNFRSLTR